MFRILEQILNEIIVQMNSNSNLNFIENNADLSTSTYKEIRFSDEFRFKPCLKKKEFLSINQPRDTNESFKKRHRTSSPILSPTKEERRLVAQHLDELEDILLTRDDYIRMALYYRSLCKVISSIPNWSSLGNFINLGF